MNVQEIAKPAGDALSFGVLLSTFANILPSIAAGFTIIWTIIRIRESKTYQDFKAHVRAWVDKLKHRGK